MPVDRQKLGYFDRQLLTAPKPCPLAKPPLTLKEIRDAIPPHMFEFNAWLSVYYIARDFVQLAATAAAAYYLLQLTANVYVRAAIWVAYAAVQGTTCFGLWVIAHECGHQAYFGKHASINDTVGYVLHTALLVPFHNWRISHGTHHRYTNHREKDTAFPEFQQPMKFWKPINIWTPLITIYMFLATTLGWIFYLFVNLEGARFNSAGPVNHFGPSSPYFKPSERHLVIGSNIGVVAVLSGLCFAAFQTSAADVLLWYGSAWLVCHMWLVTVTLLQHSDSRAPHYDNEDWDFVRGALSTIDRNYGSVLNNMLHHITDGHLVHHLFSTMPFYHAIQATPHVRKALGQYAQYDERPLFLQMCHSFFTHQTSWQHNPVWLKKQKAMAAPAATKSSSPLTGHTSAATAAKKV